MLNITLGQLQKIRLKILHKDPGTGFCHYEEIKVFRTVHKNSKVYIENEYTTTCGYVHVIGPDTLKYFIEELDYMLEEGDLHSYQNESMDNDPCLNGWALDIASKSKNYTFAGIILDEDNHNTGMYDDLYMLFSSCLGAVKFKKEDLTNEKKWVRKAANVAIQAHFGKRDGLGHDYFFGHVHHLAEKFKTDYTAQAIAYLHEAVGEDNVLSLEDLHKKYPVTIARAVDAMYQRPNAPYRDYIDILKRNDYGRMVKTEDLLLHMNLKRLGREPTEEDMKQRKKYAAARTALITETKRRRNVQKKRAAEKRQAIKDAKKAGKDGKPYKSPAHMMPKMQGVKPPAAPKQKAVTS